LDVCFDLNVIRIRANAKVEDELAEAPDTKISSSRIKGEKFHPWLERKPIQLTILATIAI
jgi:cytochrome c oxidase cbb3-type subunit I/II